MSFANEPEAPARFHTLAPIRRPTHPIALSFGVIWVALLAAFVRAPFSAASSGAFASGAHRAAPAWGALGSPDVTLALLAGSVVVYAVATAFTQRVTLDADRIALSWLGRVTHLGYGAITRIEARADGLALHCRGRRPLFVVLDAEGDPWAEATRDMLQRRIEAARLTHAFASGEQGAAMRLARNGRSMSEWLRSLRAVGDLHGADYRVNAIDDLAPPSRGA